MEPITIGTSAIGLVGLFGGLLTIYYRLKSSFTADMDAIVETQLDKHEKDATTTHNKINLKIQALELKFTNLEEHTVKKEAFVEVSSRLVHIEATLLELKQMMKDQHDRS